MMQRLSHAVHEFDAIEHGIGTFDWRLGVLLLVFITLSIVQGAWMVPKIFAHDVFPLTQSRWIDLSQLIQVCTKVLVLSLFASRVCGSALDVHRTLTSLLMHEAYMGPDIEIAKAFVMRVRCGLVSERAVLSTFGSSPPFAASSRTVEFENVDDQIHPRIRQWSRNRRYFVICSIVGDSLANFAGNAVSLNLRSPISPEMQ